MASKRTENRKEQTKTTQPPALVAYHVAERGDKSYWTRIGAAWDHDDAKGLTVQLDLMPVGGGRIVLREPNDDQASDNQNDPGASA